jgi:hypothetical protein
LVEASDVTSPSDGKNYRLDGAHGAGVSPPHFQSFRLGEYQVATHADFPDDARAVKELWKDHCDGLDLLEPFERIREAIHEAQRPAK